MKIICTLLALVIAPAVRAQVARPIDPEYCKQIVKDTSVDKMTFDFFSPYDHYAPPSMRVSRSYSIDNENPYDNFNIIFQIFNPDLESTYTVNANGEREEKIEKKIVIEFDDKSKIINDSVDINHDFSDDKTQALRYAYFPVTDENIKDFLTKRIVKFSLAGYEQVVPDDSTHSFQKFLQCIKAVK